MAALLLKPLTVCGYSGLFALAG